MSARSSRPSLPELRAVVHPPGLLDRNSGEHWAGRLYVRRLSPHLTRLLLRTPLSPNAVTWLMIAAGVAAAAVLTLPGLWAAVVAVLLIQLQILLDCSDGEMARWQERYSLAGIYLDRFGHYVTETALPIALGIRADGGWDSIGGWTTLGLVAAVLALLVRTESALVAVARLESGRPPAPDTAEAAAPRSGLLARLRRWIAFAPVFRAFVAVEATLLALAAAVVDTIRDDLAGTQALVLALVPIAAFTAAGHLAAILTSQRLR